jgi:hypothetical protein
VLEPTRVREATFASKLGSEAVTGGAVLSSLGAGAFGRRRAVSEPGSERASRSTFAIVRTKQKNASTPTVACRRR